MTMDSRGVFLQHSTPDLLCFSHSSVPQSAFLRRRRRTRLASSTLGKRNRSYRHSPVLIDEQRHKRPRHIAPGRKHEAPGAPPARPAPWHQNDRFVRKFKRQEFERALAVPPTLSCHFAQFPLGNDVDFPIHPIFRSLSGLIPELYPSLRLATRFLSSRQCLPFFHSLITSPLTLLQFESQYYATPLTHLAPSPYQATGLPDAERDLTIRTMVALAPHINLQMSPNPRLALRWAYTERTSPPQHATTGLASAYDNIPQLFPTPAQLHNNIQGQASNNPLVALNFCGTNALINMSVCFLHVLHPHTFPAPSPAQKLRCAFMLALALVHEVAHAVYMCRFPSAPLIPDFHLPAPAAADDHPRAADLPPSLPDPDTRPPSTHQTDISLSNGQSFSHALRGACHATRPRLRAASEEHEPFFGRHRKPELGHAWEACVFGGGRICSLASCDDFSLGLGWQRWPGTDEFYVLNWRGEVVPLVRKTHPDGGDGGGGPGRGAPGSAPKWETMYVMGDAWVWKWFLNGFWASVEANGLGNVGKVEKQLGARLRNYDWVDLGHGDGWASSSSSRERGADGGGVVRLGQAWVESEDEMDDDDDDDDS